VELALSAGTILRWTKQDIAVGVIDVGIGTGRGVGQCVLTVVLPDAPIGAVGNGVVSHDATVTRSEIVLERHA
jgi:hypothetical protein